MNRRDIENKIVTYFNDYLAEVVTWEEITDKTFVEAGLDSIDNIEGILAAEDEFEIEILDSEASLCKTFNDFVNLIENKLEGK